MKAPVNSLLNNQSPDKNEELTVEQGHGLGKRTDEVASPQILAFTKNIFPYRFNTDDSSYRVGSAHFQTDSDNVLRPLGFCSRTINSHENIYFSSEK